MVDRILENRFQFTKKDLERKKAPAKVITYHDTDTDSKGLICRHYPATIQEPKGRKSFAFRTRISGRQYFFKIGDFPTCTISMARDKISEFRTSIAHGENPGNDRTALAAKITFGEMFETYLARHAKPHKRPRSIQEDERQFNQYLKSKWGKRKLVSIKKPDVLEVYFHTGDNSGPYAANRLLALLSTIFGKAIEWGLYRDQHPAKIPAKNRYKEKKRARFLDRDELGGFFQALDNEPNTTARDYIYMLLLTGARMRDGLSARWVDLDLIDRVWKIPDPKGGESYSVPIVEPLWQLLVARLCDSIGQGYPGHWNRIQDMSDPASQEEKTATLIQNLNRVRIAAKSPFVFPGTGSSGHYAEPKTAWKRIIIEAGLYSDDPKQRPRLHDLRRSMGSWQTIGGASLSIVGKSLGHKTPTATAIYAHLDLDPVRESMENAASLMLGNIKKPNA